MRFLLYLLAFYLAYQLLIKPLLKVLLQQVLQKEIRKFQSGNQQQQKPKRPEGSIYVDYVPDKQEKKSGKKSDSDGEYIDYEEVK